LFFDLSTEMFINRVVLFVFMGYPQLTEGEMQHERFLEKSKSIRAGIYSAGLAVAVGFIAFFSNNYLKHVDNNNHLSERTAYLKQKQELIESEGLRDLLQQRAQLTESLTTILTSDDGFMNTLPNRRDAVQSLVNNVYGDFDLGELVD